MKRRGERLLPKQCHKGTSLLFLLILLGLGTWALLVTVLHTYYYDSSSSSTEHHNNPVLRALQQMTTEDQPFNISLMYPIESPIPNPPLSDGNSTFSSCLLVMDDNHRLMEWIAYHYHVLPLRTIVVAVDPRSKTSPTWLFNLWRQQGVYVEEWNDRDFWRKDLPLQPIQDHAELQIKRDRHRGRQKYFYRRCLQYLQTKQRTWVALHDTDEYLVYNHAGGDQYTSYMRKLKQKYAHVPESAWIHPAQTPPTTATPGALLQYLRHEQAAGLTYYQSPCIGVPRLQFGAKELAPSNITTTTSIVDPTQLDTLRYNCHATRNDFVKNALGKVIMDVSRIDMTHAPYFMSLHRPIKEICPPPWLKDWESGFRLYHYLGSWESYSIRDDARKGGERCWEQWEYKATTIEDECESGVIEPWLEGFVAQMGRDTARQLLRHAGLPKRYHAPHDGRWRLSPERLQEILSNNVTYSNDNKKVAFDAWVREKYGRQQDSY